MKTLRKPRVLLVDDELNIVKVVSKRLSVSGFEVVTALDGQEALSQVAAAAPDLIVLDVMLPKLNGLQVCAQLKHDARYRHIPIILFTAKTEEKDREAGLAAGADAYLTKPYQPAELRQIIDRLLKRAESS
jgi:DNA-binding response OmpR family regulator